LENAGFDLQLKGNKWEDLVKANPLTKTNSGT